MKKAKRNRLERRGWRVGSAAEFLKLSAEEAALLETKLGDRKVLPRRTLAKWTMRDRGFRRHQQARVKARVRRYYYGWAGSSARTLGRTARTRTPCSCWMCGNPRRTQGEITAQERRAPPADPAWNEHFGG